MPARTAGRKGRPWRRVCDTLKRTMPWVCSGCGKPIDRDLHHNDPMAWTADHIVPLSRGGSSTIENLAPMHRACNSSKRDGRKPAGHTNLDW